MDGSDAEEMMQMQMMMMMMKGKGKGGGRGGGKVAAFGMLHRHCMAHMLAACAATGVPPEACRYHRYHCAFSTVITVVVDSQDDMSEEDMMMMQMMMMKGKGGGRGGGKVAAWCMRLCAPSFGACVAERGGDDDDANDDDEGQGRWPWRRQVLNRSKG